MDHKKIVKILVVVLVALGVAAGIVAAVLYGRYQDLKANPIQAFETSSGQGTVIAEGKAFAQPTEFVRIDGKRYGKNPNVVSILMMGVDWDGSQERADTGKRSDMVILCTVDLENNTIDFHSIPRDTRTTVHAVDKKTGKIQDRTYLTKINHAYALGALHSDEAGAENEMLAVEDLLSCGDKLNIPVDYYLSLELRSLADLANVLGGVEVELDQDVPGIGSKGETVLLEGDNVRHYLEKRKDVGGEMSRQRHQQEFIKAIARAVKKLGAAQTATRLLPKLEEIGMQTNMNLDQVAATAGVLDKIGSIDNVSMQTFADESDNWPSKMHDPVLDTDVYYYLMDDEELLDTMLSLYYIEDGNV
ncbi:MAG: LCP family protein [Christensenella sp.]|uniref:LCP family protein n=1 Tax=Christensenella sp. TaxID=1935934 RepID=UPI002B1FB207|nr:LCP family protein [Christensenella sp.]MEA5004662.1 LCP family protein [Christensenella sp.]